MDKHTPGPWITQSGSYNDECRVVTAATHEHPQDRTLGVRGGTAPVHTVIANFRKPEDAQLGAAAPELLEALHVSERALTAAILGKTAFVGTALTEVRAAIAKATSSTERNSP